MVEEYPHSLTLHIMPYHRFKIDLVPQIQRILNGSFVSMTCIILGLLSVFQTEIMLQITTSLLASNTHTGLSIFHTQMKD